MRRIVILLTVVAAFAAASDALSLSRPLGRRSNGDPDEFQARQVLDEGIAVRDTSIDACGKSGTGQPPAAPCKASPFNRKGIQECTRGAQISIKFSGRTVFLER